MLDGTKQADVQGGGGMSQGDYSTELKTARSQRRRLTTMYEKL